MLSVSMPDFAGLEAKLRAMANEAETKIHNELQTFGEETVTELQQIILSGQIAPPKVGGGVTFVDTGNYVNSYDTVTTGVSMGLGPTGDNKNMPNADLADLLEFGSSIMPARPHVRPMILRVETRLPRLGKRISNAVLGRP